MTQAWFDGDDMTIAVSGDRMVRAPRPSPPPEGAKAIDGILDHLIDEYDVVLQLGDLMFRGYSRIWWLSGKAAYPR